MVSRHEIFTSESSDGESLDHNEGYGTNNYGNFEFGEVEVEDPKSPQPEEQPQPDGDLIAFQLFANSGPVQIDLHARPETIEQSRPDSYYFFSITPEDKLNIQKTAVSGESVLQEAHFWEEVFSGRNYNAPDINADWKPKKKKARPGKSARASRRHRKETAEQRRKEDDLRWEMQRRQKPREPLRIPSQIPKQGGPNQSHNRQARHSSQTRNKPQARRPQQHQQQKQYQQQDQQREQQPKPRAAETQTNVPKKSPKLGHRVVKPKQDANIITFK